MPNDDHIAWLNEGVADWNDWRKENPDIRPDLSKANLYQEHLADANLSNANLSEAILSEADLTRADLTRADLKGRFS